MWLQQNRKYKYRNIKTTNDTLLNLTKYRSNKCPFLTKKHVVTANVIKVSQWAGHNDETTEKSLLCVKEVSMKVNASRRFIGIMGLLSWFSLDFTHGCNLCKSTICQFTLKENKPVPNCATVNGLSYDTCPCSKVWPASSHFTSSIMCVSVWPKFGMSVSVVSLLVTKSESTFSDSNWVKHNPDTFKIMESWHIISSILDSAALSHKVICKRARVNHCSWCQSIIQVTQFNSAPVRPSIDLFALK